MTNFEDLKVKICNVAILAFVKFEHLDTQIWPKMEIDVFRFRSLYNFGVARSHVLTLATFEVGGFGRQNRRLESSLLIIQEFIFWLVYCIFCVYVPISDGNNFSLSSANRRTYFIISDDVIENEV